MHRGVVGLVAACVLNVALVVSSWATELLPPRQAPIFLKAPLIRAWSWTGFYAGGDIGAEWTNTVWSATSLRDPPGIICPGVFGLPIDGTSPSTYYAIGPRVGGFAGYDWQFAPTWVAGLQADFGYAHKTTTKAGFPGCTNGCVGGPGVFFGAGSAGGDTTSVTVGWDAAALLRLGYLATPNVLLYATGGVAWQSFEATGNCGPWQTSFYCGGPGQPNPSSVTQSAVLTGWTAGGGAEWHAWGHWLMRAEYRFADFGTWSGVFPFGATTIGDNTYRYQLKAQTQIGSIGLAYRF